MQRGSRVRKKYLYRLGIGGSRAVMVGDRWFGKILLAWSGVPVVRPWLVFQCQAGCDGGLRACLYALLLRDGSVEEII